MDIQDKVVSHILENEFHLRFPDLVESEVVSYLSKSDELVEQSKIKQVSRGTICRLILAGDLVGEVCFFCKGTGQPFHWKQCPECQSKGYFLSKAPGRGAEFSPGKI